MRLACANGYKITGLQFAEGIVRAHVKNSPFNIHDVEYLFAAHDKVTILDDTEPEPEEPMTPVPTRLLDQLREVAPRVVVACNSERDELQPMGYAIAEHDTAEAILAAIDRDNQPR